MTTPFRIYTNGHLHYTDERISTPVSFAQVTDIHLSPCGQENWPEEYRHAIGWWDKEFEHPHEVLVKMLDTIRDDGVDFVFFGGDNLDYYDAHTAEHIVTLCSQRGLACYFQFGNHDFETAHIRYVTHDNDEHIRSENGAKLYRHWSMPNRYYAFEHGGIRFIVLDTPYVMSERGYGGLQDKQQVDWLIDQLRYEGPIIIFQHIPFKLPTNEARLRIAWNGVEGWIVDDDNAQRAMSAIGNCANVLGVFCGHTHIRSEDPIGGTWQFVTAAGGLGAGQWRHVCVSNIPAPKSLRIEGAPTVDTISSLKHV